MRLFLVAWLFVLPACTTPHAPVGDGDGGGGLNSVCTADAECASHFCEALADGSGDMVCATSACAECEGLNTAGHCVALTNGMTSASCGGTCSGSYAGPTGGQRACCASACVCTSGGVCPSP